MKIAEVKLSYSTKIKASEREKVDTSLKASKIFRPFFAEFMEHKECAFVMLLNQGNHVLGVMKLSEGGISGALIDVRLLFQAAILANASGFILCHNHPSGILNTSDSDLKLTKKVHEGAKLLDLELLDHIIITKDSYLSMADEKLIEL